MRSLTSCRVRSTLTFALVVVVGRGGGGGGGGGGDFAHTICFFFENNENTQGTVISAQVTRSGQATLPPKIFIIAPWLQLLSDLYETCMS